MAEDRKGRTIGIATVTALALFFQGCSDEETAYCVDEADAVVDNQNCYDYEDGVTPVPFFWAFLGGDVDKKKIKKGTKIAAGLAAAKIAANNKSALQSRGGFGSQARTSGVGRVSAGG